MTYKVIQWGTGNAGFHSLRALIRRPDFELVGLCAFSSEKVGKDAGEIAGIEERTGILATGDKNKILEKEDNLVFSPVHSFGEVVEDPQVIANEYIADFDHPVIGKYRVVGMPVKFSKTPGQATGEAPEFGQHTEEVLIEVLGYSWDDIIKLKEDEVI